MSLPISPRSNRELIRRAIRRRFIAAGAGALVAPNAAAQMAIDIGVRAVKELVGNRIVMLGRVRIEANTLTDNGHSVPIRVSVLSPMTAADHVRSVHLFADGNPRPRVAVFHFGPASGRAEIATRIRLAGTQRVYAVATMSDGAFWADHRDITVTESACLDGS